MDNALLSLSAALKFGRTAEFIAEQEARGIGPVDEADFDALAAKVIKTERSGDQTYHSLPADGSPGK